MRDVYIASAVRTAIGKLCGALAGFSAVDLGTIAVREAIARAGVSPEDIDQVVMGQAVQAGAGSNPARQVSLLSGIPVSVPSYTVNMVCGSGMKAVSLGALAIRTGEAEIVAAGGMESMSNAPYLLDKARKGYRLGDAELFDSLLRDALIDPLGRYHMAMTAERLAEERGISRGDQDSFALGSQRKAKGALEAGVFAAEIVPVRLPSSRGNTAQAVFDRDESPRPDADAASLAGLKPAFKEGGTVTAGNASGINDGAAALVLVSGEEARRRGMKPLGKIVAAVSVGVEPERMGLGPVVATHAVVRAAGLSLSDISSVELNEAFAAQALAVIRELALEPDIVNPNGGAIALGHPLGSSGARILVTLLHHMERQGGRFGLATLCIGGGQGMAVVVER